MPGVWLTYNSRYCYIEFLINLIHFIFISANSGFFCMSIILILLYVEGFPGGSDGKESACSARNPSLIPGSGRSPGEGNAYPLQNSYLENSMDR